MSLPFAYHSKTALSLLGPPKQTMTKALRLHPPKPSDWACFKSPRCGRSWGARQCGRLSLFAFVIQTVTRSVNKAHCNFL